MLCWKNGLSYKEPLVKPQIKKIPSRNARGWYRLFLCLKIVVINHKISIKKYVNSKGAPSIFHYVPFLFFLPFSKKPHVIIYETETDFFIKLLTKETIMTVSSTTARDVYTGDGTEGPFPYTFRILDSDHAAVYVDGDLKTKDTDYSVSGVGEDEGGNITFLAGHYPVSGAQVVIIGNIPYSQTTDYTENDAFPATSHEDALDKIVMQVKQLAEKLGRTLSLSVGSPYSSIIMPDPETDKVMQWQSDDTLSNVSLAEIGALTVSAFGETLIDDADAAAALATLELTVSAFGKTLIDDADAETARTTLDAQEAVMTTRGDIAIRDALNDTARLGAGTAGQVLTSDGTDVSWSDGAAPGDGTISQAKLKTSTGSVNTSSNDLWTALTLPGVNMVSIRKLKLPAV